MISHAILVAEVHPSFPLPPGTCYVEDFMCNGTESSLSQCSYSPPTSPECHMGNHSAAVVCREGITAGYWIVPPSSSYQLHILISSVY